MLSGRIDNMDIASFVVGMLGLIVSSLGFGLWQIIKTRSAAESAERAATEAREAVLHVTSVSDLSQASAQIELLKEIVRNQQWQRAIDRYTPLRQLLIDVEARLPNETKGLLGDKLRRAIEQLLIMENESNKAVAERTDIDATRFQSMLLEIQNEIDKAQAELEQELTGAP